MYITKVSILNYRTIRKATIPFNEKRNIIVGPNETGKSTLLEALNLVLTGQLNGRSILFDLHPYLFNADCVEDFIESLKQGKKIDAPTFRIEAFLSNDDQWADLKGLNNSLGEDVPGLVIQAELDPAYAPEYEAFIKLPDQITSLPVEYYKVTWRSFAGKPLHPRAKPLKVSLIDTSESRSHNPNRFVVEKIVERLQPAERAKMGLSYRKMKEAFVSNETVKAINDDLDKDSSISHKTLSVDLDVTSRGSWESGVITKLDKIPFEFIGKGEQNSVRIHLALDAATQCQILLLEEPENHLAYPNLNQLINRVCERASDKQLFITTHSNFVLNKLDIANVLLFRNNKAISLADLSADTRDFFIKLPGHDTLRMVLASMKVILVEGPSDELIVQKAFKETFGCLPLEAGVDVITTRALSFKRFLEIAALLDIETRVITDNDGDLAALEAKYKDYKGNPRIKLHYDTDVNYKTLEPQLFKANGLKGINKLLGKDFENEEEAIAYMTSNKTDCALKIFNSSEPFIIPKYINDAICE